MPLKNNFSKREVVFAFTFRNFFIFFSSFLKIAVRANFLVTNFIEKTFLNHKIKFKFHKKYKKHGNYERIN